ncbi:c-type cytochrome [Methylobacterium iners]|uniref:Nicotinate dehydrogenase subunit B n=1 Tax=Methylobacterium iners TaxID=418707 RepID=A0ABQ4RZF1_9HYPH|nr:c-type cytochrome [Methylobacterium iners]GJD96230.1 Nicotinate dehydrogenase subunit B [Methylobacterium iners]
MLRWWLLALATLVLVAIAGFAALAWQPSLPPAALPVTAFDPSLVARGRDLALIGNCNTCHTQEGGKAYAGGKPIPTPFGTIHATNVTPDPETGIGQWSLTAFVRSMREGVDREGNHLYPAFPYDHYARVTDEDLAALYAFLMTRRAVRHEAPPPDLPFPLNQRPLLAGWKLLFLKAGSYRPDPARSVEWNRGAYLAEGLGHCGACHTPRNRLGAEIASEHYNGGEAENWWGPPLNASSPASVPWTEASLFNYLRDWDPKHGGAVGPMAPVSHNLSQVGESEVRAMATYLTALMGPPSGERLGRTEAIAARPDAAPDPRLAAGERIYAGACATCHASGGQVPYTVNSLAYHTTLFGPDPRNVIQAVLRGIRPPEGAAGAIMPGYAEMLTDGQVADLLDYLRARFSDAPPWTDLERKVREVREDIPPTSGSLGGAQVESTPDLRRGG